MASNCDVKCINNGICSGYCERHSVSASFSDELLSVFGVWIVGHDAYPVAIFRYQEQAEDWARENYFGQWLMKPMEIPATPFATDEEIEQARIKAEELVKCFEPCKTAD